ncbi:MAG: hypothetical protein P4N41_25480 [Negativicutes bacterium]|nr:hypothetical protein [Negativicutes bacterium]
MILSLSRRSLAKRGKLCLLFLLVIALLFYLLPKLFALYWEENTWPKIRDNSVPDKPLKVISSWMSNT